MRLIDLSMEVYKGMMTYPNVAKPAIVEMETHREMAKSIGSPILDNSATSAFRESTTPSDSPRATARLAAESRPRWR